MTALPAPQTLTAYRGDPYDVTLSAKVAGVAETVADATAALAQVRASVDADTVLAEFDVAVTGAGTVVTLSLTPEQTAAMPVGRHVWDFQPSPDAETWVGGPFILEGDVSRP